MKYTLLINDQPVFHSEMITPAVEYMVKRQGQSCLKWSWFFYYNNPVMIINNHTQRIAWNKNEDKLITIKN